MAIDDQIDPIKKIGNDSTATFENDPTFVDANPGAIGSSENVEEQRDTDDIEDSEEELEEDGDVDEDEEFDDEDEADDEDEDDADEEEDDAEEVAAAPAMRADGLLGYEDEAEDVQKGRSEEQGNAERARAEDATDEDDDEGDLAPGVSEDEFSEDDMDTDRVAALQFNQLQWPVEPYGFRGYIGSQPNTFGMLQ